MKISKLLLGTLIVALCVAIPANAASVDLDKDTIPNPLASYHVGELITYECVVTNNNEYPMTVENVFDNLPDGGTINPLVHDTLVLPYTLASGASAIYTVTYTVNQAGLQEINGDTVVINEFGASGFVTVPTEPDPLFDPFGGSVFKSSRIVSNPNTLATISADPAVGVAPYDTYLTLTETNTGDDPLTGVYVQLIDPDVPVVIDTLDETDGSWDDNGGNGDDVLDVGETWSWLYGPVAVTGPATFEIRGYGTGPLGTDVSPPTFPNEKDTVDVDAITPAIVIIKSGPAYSKSEGPWGDGDIIQYQAVITNTGTEILEIVSVIDDVVGSLGSPVGAPLSPGESLTVSYAYSPLPTDPDPLINIVTVVASYDVEGVIGTVNDNDDHEVDLVHPDFTVDKICLNDPVPEGEDAQFEITITNIGDIPLIITSDEPELAGPLDLVPGQPIVQVVTRPIPDSVVINTIIVVATLPAEFDLPNVIERSDTAECGTQGDTFCSFTQGFYGNEGGKACGGMTTRDIIDAVLGNGVLVGVLGQRSILFNSADCIIDLLPAGGPPKSMNGRPFDVDCDHVPDKLIKKGRLNNVLIGQVVALSLNVRLSSIPCLDDGEPDSPLGSFVFPGDPEVEEDVYLCVEGADGCIIRYLVPQSLKGMSVDELLLVANQALAGDDVGNIGQIANGAGFINEAFDECASVVTCPIDPVEICDNGCDDDFDGTVDENVEEGDCIVILE